MNTRRIGVTLGAAGGGVLAAALLSTGLAHADTVGDAAAAPAPGDTVAFVPVGNEQITSISGISPLDQQTSGYVTLDINDTTAAPAGTTDTIGTISTLENSTAFDGGFTNAESVVTAVTPDTGITLPTAVPVDGTITDTFQYQAMPSLFSNTYTEIPGATSTALPTATDTLTVFGVTLPSFDPGFLASNAFPLGLGGSDFGPFLTAPDVVADLTSPAAVTLGDSIATGLGLPTSDVPTFLADLASLF